MQKVVGSNPISRSDGNPLETAGSSVVAAGLEIIEIAFGSA